MLLIKRAQKHDTDAFIQLIDEYKTALYKVAKTYLKNEEDVADAIQDTILSAYEHIGELKTVSYFKTWLTRILINHCTDVVRRQKRTVSMEQAEEQAGTWIESDYEFMICCGSFRKRIVPYFFYIMERVSIYVKSRSSWNGTKTR